MKKAAKSFYAKLTVFIGTLLVFLMAGVLAACGGIVAIDFTMKFEAGEGNEIPAIVAKAGEEITPPQDPTKTGFEFEGWYLTEDGTGERQTIPSVMPEENRTYYAKWTALPSITLNLNGGTLTGGTTLYLKAGSNLYAFMQSYIPEKTGYHFHAWAMNEAELTSDTAMPAGGATLTALWDIPYTIKFYTFDFATYDQYIEGETQTGYALPGSTVDGSDLVPEHYTLNTEKTIPMTVTEGAENVLSVYINANHKLYTDVFESEDYLIEPETEEGVLYLDRIGMEEGRKKSTTYDKATGHFTFQTDKEGFTLEGMISGEKFYYFRDTLEQTFADYLGSEATLEIQDGQKVIYTPAEGAAIEGVYTVDVEKGVYVVTPAQGEPFEFVLIQAAGVLYFRLYDGVTGSYAYGGELADGGWYYFVFDGFGTATYYDSDYPDEPEDYEYALQANGIIKIASLGLIKLTKGETTLEGGPTVDGTFITSDGYEGEYEYTNGYRREVLTLDGFGGASYNKYVEGVLAEDGNSTGTYTIQEDESFLIEGYNYTGAYSIGYYGGVNEWLEYTANGTTTKYILGEEEDYEGTTTYTFEEFKETDFDVAPGLHKVTNGFTYKGTHYTVDDDHPAFLYFYLDKTVDLWYGEYIEEYEDFVYDYIVGGEWYYASWDGSSELYNDDYDGMYFGEMAEDGSFDFTEETWEGEPDQTVFYNGTEGKLYIDPLGAYFQPAEGDRIAVDYEVVATGLVYILKFTFPESVPATVHTDYAIYDSYYDITADEETLTVYDLSAEGVQYLTLVGADGSEGGVALLITQDKTFVGVLFEYTTDPDDPEASYTAYEFVLAGEIAEVADSQDEYTFTMDENIYYDELDYIDDAESIIATFGQFQYKIATEVTFYYYDGEEYTLTSGENTLETDGYGFATLTLNGEEFAGFYDVTDAIYNVLYVFTEDGEEYDLCIDAENDSFTIIDTTSPQGKLLGYYYDVVLSEDGEPEGVTSDALFLDGVGGFTYEEVIYSEDGYDYEIVTKHGSYKLLNPTKNVIELTFEDNGPVWEATIYYYDFFGDGRLFPFVAIRNDAIMGTYIAYTDDEAELGLLTGGDGYYEWGATFTGEDADGPFSYEGYMARGTMEDTSYQIAPQFEEDTAGNVVVFVAVVDGQQLQWVFDIKETTADGEIKVYYREKFYGAVAEYTLGGTTTGNYIYADGHSKATLYDAEGNVLDEGTYAFAPDMENAYLFNGETNNFAFKTMSMSYGGGVLYIYTVYTEADDLLYINDDWSILYMDGFGNASYVDAYGALTTGEYYEFTDGVYCIKVFGTADRIFFEVDKEHKSFHACEGDFLVKEGVLYMYFGTDESITIPDGVQTIASRAFMLDGSYNIKYIDFNNVTRIEAYALNGASNLVELSSDKIEYIGEYAFADLWAITTVDLPNLKTLGAYAFYGCRGLTSVKLGAALESIGAYAFSKNLNSIEVPFVLDLTAVTDFTKIDIDLTAFVAYQGWFGIVNKTFFAEGDAILVSGGVEALNAAAKKFKGETASISYHDLNGTADAPNKTGKIAVDLTPYLTLMSSGEDAMAGTAFYDFLNDTLYLFRNFELIAYAKDGWSYQPTTLASYYIQDGEAQFYALQDGTFAVTATCAKGAAQFQYGGKAALPLGTEQKPSVLKTQDEGGKDIEIGFYLTYVAEYGFSMYFHLTSIKYDGVDAENPNFNQYDKKLTFRADGTAYEGLIADGKITVKNLGKEYTIEDTTDSATHYRATVRVDAENKLTLIKMESKNVSEEGGEYSEIYSYDEIGEGLWSFMVYAYDGNPNRVYQIKITAGASGAAPTLKVELLGYQFSIFRPNSCTIVLKIEDGKIIELTQCKEGYDVATTKNVEIATDGLSVTFETEKSKYQFTLTVEEGVYSGTIKALRYVAGLFTDDSDYYADVTLNAEGEKKTIEKVENFKLYMSGTVLEIQSQTVNADGSVTVTITGGTKYKISLGQNEYGSDCIIVEEVTE